MTDLFDVIVEPTGQGRYRISITTNGYQWHTLSVPVRDPARADRIRDFLKAELAEDARLDLEEIERSV